MADRRTLVGAMILAALLVVPATGIADGPQEVPVDEAKRRIDNPDCTVPDDSHAVTVVGEGTVTTGQIVDVRCMSWVGRAGGVYISLRERFGVDNWECGPGGCDPQIDLVNLDGVVDFYVELEDGAVGEVDMMFRTEL